MISSTADLHLAFYLALQAALVLFVSHFIAVAILMYKDLTGEWENFAINKKRPADRRRSYWLGWRSFCVDLIALFIPLITLIISVQVDAIQHSNDTWQSAISKFVSGYVLGKLWAFAVHYALHFPSLYRFHRRHHRSPANMVASAAWDDSFVEYAIMEIPSFAMTLLLFPTNWYFHLAHFALHGIDGAAGHSGFAGAPGFLGYVFDSEYHYYHHAYLNVNYAELEIIDKLFGTHHSHQERFSKVIGK